VARTVSLGAEEVAPGYFAVTVAAEVVIDEQDAAGTWFFSIGVAETANGWTTPGLPSLIPAPPQVDAPALLVDRLDGLSEPGIEELLTRFLAAYLTGDGELARYVSPASNSTAVQPAPFTEVEVVSAGAGEPSDGLTPVVVVARVADSAGRTQLLEYSLMVSQRDGRWEVADLLPAPLLAPTDTN